MFDGYKNNKNSHSRRFCKTGALKNFATFKGKDQWRSFFFSIVAGWRPATFLKKASVTGVSALFVQNNFEQQLLK